MKLFLLLATIIAVAAIGGIGIYTAIVSGWWIVAAVVAVGVGTLQVQLMDVAANVASGRKWWR